jgi:hypothetical protein
VASLPGGEMTMHGMGLIEEVIVDPIFVEQLSQDEG